MEKKLNIKKLLIIVLIAVLVIVGIVLIVTKVMNKEPETPIDEQSPIIQLPETTYSDMQVKNIQMEYLKDQNKTVLRFDIFNTTANKVQEQSFEAILIGPNDEVLAEMPYVYIQSLEVGQQHALEVIYTGDLTATKQIKLIEK